MRGVAILGAIAASPLWLVAAVGVAQAPDADGPIGDEERIEDEELSGEDGLIDDPELEGLAAPDAPTPDASTPSPKAESERTRLVLELHSRLGLDMRWDLPHEEVLESFHMGLLELHHRASDTFSVSLGTRLRYVFASRRSFEGSRQAYRHEVHLVPTAAHLDITPAPSVHARVGYQIVQLGRFEATGASDVLAVRDLRTGPATPPDATQVATPAVRLDWDARSWLTFTAVYQPWFEPHRYDLLGTDYALMRLQGSAGGMALLDTLEQLVDRSFIPGYTSETLRILGPEPSFAHPQGALRAVARGTPGELGVTVATALDRVGAIGISQGLEQYMQGDITFDELVADAADNPPLFVGFPRSWVFSVDGAVDAGPVQVGAEVAYLKDRVLYAAQAGRFPQPALEDMLHFAVRAEHVAGVGRYVAVETFTQVALGTPELPDRAWFTLDRGRLAWGVALMGRWDFTPKWSVEGTVLLFQGPSLVAVPRFVWRPDPHVFVELGAMVVQGPPPVEPGSPNTAVGTIYDPVDQVFLGLGYRL
jgi:hypothetical protein